MRFMKFAPFLGFPVLMFFPSGMTLYWVTVSALQLITTLVIRNKSLAKFLGVPDYLPGTILYHKNIRQAEIQRLREQQLAEKISLRTTRKTLFSSEPTGPTHQSSGVLIPETDGKFEAKTTAKETVQVYSSRPKKLK